MYLIKGKCFQGKNLKAQEGLQTALKSRGLVVKGEIQTAYSGGV